MEEMVDQVSNYEANGVLQSVLKPSQLNNLNTDLNDTTAVAETDSDSITGGPHLAKHNVDLAQSHACNLNSNEETLVNGTALSHSPNSSKGELDTLNSHTRLEAKADSGDDQAGLEDDASRNVDISMPDNQSSQDSESNGSSPVPSSGGHSVDSTVVGAGILVPSERVEIPDDGTERVPSSPTASSSPNTKDPAPIPYEGGNEIPAVTQAANVATIDSSRTGEEEKTESQTSFVNEYALSSSDSPTYEVDRNLEQFSEILLDSDPSHSDNEAEIEVVDEATSPKKKTAKKVRFADEITGKLEEYGSRHGRCSPPPPPSGLPTHPSPSSSTKHPGVPITASPTSPRQKVPLQRYTVDELISGVDLPAEYLGSTPIMLDGLGAMKSARMYQAQQAVQLIKDPESKSRPHFAVKLKVSTGAIRIANSATDVDLMDHPLHTITYVADIDNVLVIMAHIRPPAPPTPNPAPSSPNSPGPRPGESTATEGDAKYMPKMTCHVLDSSNAREAAMVIGQAFSAAYKHFLRSSGVSDQQLEQAEYAHILNAQSIPQLEVESLGDRTKIKKLTLAKHKNDIMGMMVMESGYGSAIPACVIVQLSKTGSATKCGLLNVGDHILSINGVNLVGMPRKACLEHIKKCRYMNVVKMEVCSCPAVVDVTIVRPDLKYQLGFSIHEGMICSLVRGSIAERSGVRVGHRIIDINGTSTVGMQHSDIVHLLSSTVGDLHIRMMPDLMYKLMTGKLQPEYY